MFFLLYPNEYFFNLGYPFNQTFPHVVLAFQRQPMPGSPGVSGPGIIAVLYGCLLHKSLKSLCSFKGQALKQGEALKHGETFCPWFKGLGTNKQ